jgi:hypothetical protein
LKLWANVELPLPADPRCPDPVFAHIPANGGAIRYLSAATPECEALPKLAVVGHHAVLASVLRTPKTPEPNDTYQYDLGVVVADLVTGEVRNLRVAYVEDDWAYTVAQCGENRVCVGGVTGSKSVDTGSTVTFGKGFVVPIDVRTGEVGELRSIASPRHAEVRELVPHPDGVLFFATVNGPITHTADADRWLGFNEGLLGLLQRF